MYVYNTHQVMWRNTFSRLGSCWDTFCPTVQVRFMARGWMFSLIWSPDHQQASTISTFSNLCSPCLQTTQIQNVWHHNTGQTSQKNYKYAYKYTAKWPLWKETSLITELSAQYTTWPNYTHITSTDASHTIPHSPTSHFTTPHNSCESN